MSMPTVPPSQTAENCAELIALRARCAVMASALERIIARSSVIACPNHEGRRECIDCYFPWPRDLRAPNEDEDDTECIYCIARAVRAARRAAQP